MAVTVTVYDHVAELLLKDLNLSTATLKLALVSSSYTHSDAHTVWADASANEITGTNYTAGGETLANVTVGQTSGVGKLDADDVTWSTATLTCRRGLLYVVGTVDSKVNPLILSILFNDAPADVAVTAINFQAIWAAAGILTVTVN